MGILIFSKTKFFLYFEKRKPLKCFLHFRKWNFLYFEEELPKPPKTKISYVSQKEVMNKISKNTLG